MLSVGCGLCPGPHRRSRFSSSSLSCCFSWLKTQGKCTHFPFCPLAPRGTRVPAGPACPCSEPGGSGATTRLVTSCVCWCLEVEVVSGRWRLTSHCAAWPGSPRCTSPGLPETATLDPLPPPQLQGKQSSLCLLACVWGGGVLVVFSYTDIFI